MEDIPMKKLLSICLAMIFVISSLAFPTLADEKNQPTPDELEKIIKQVRSVIDVPEEYNVFSWNYSAASYYSESVWNLRWNDKDYTGNVRISCDKNGRITSYSVSDYNKDYSITLPEKSPDEMRSIADEFLAKTAPYAAKSMQYDSYFSSGRYISSYIYNYVRYENGVIVPDNTASVYVDYTTGSVTGFTITYNDGLEFDSDKELITSQKAKEILSTKQKMNLSYRLKTQYDDETGKLISRKAYLVYTPETGYLSVDAVSGEVYTERNVWEVNTKGEAGSGNTMNGIPEISEDAAADKEYELTDEEKAELEVLKGLITKDEAIKNVTGNKHLYIDPDATAVNAVLRRDSYGRYFNLYDKADDENQKYYWQISFTSPSDDNSFYHYMYAVVDAQNGSLLSFEARVPDYDYYLENKLEIPALSYNDEQTQSIADEFLKEYAGEIYGKTRLSNSTSSDAITYIESASEEDENVIEKIPVYRTASYDYVRVNEGVDFSYNHINTCVDKVNGKITSFSYSWYDDVEFESPKEVIDEKEAFDSLYSSEGFGLNYEINSTYTYNKYLADSSKGELIDYDKLYETSQNERMVYSLYNAGTTTVRALDGKLIDYSGEEYKKEQATEYTDIGGHWAEDIIKLFSYIGIGFDGTEFRPDDDITSADFQKLLWDCDITGFSQIDAASESITRAEAVREIIDGLGYGKIAELENVFITDFADNMELEKQDIGYIAIARGFGLIEGDGENFRAYEKLSRAEAMRLCFNVIKNKAFIR